MSCITVFLLLLSMKIVNYGSQFIVDINFLRNIAINHIYPPLDRLLYVSKLYLFFFGKRLNFVGLGSPPRLFVRDQLLHVQNLVPPNNIPDELLDIFTRRATTMG